MSRDWTGNSRSVFSCLGANNYSQHEREANDYYATEPKAVELLLEQEKFRNNILEPACGEGHMSVVLSNHGYNVRSSDIVDRGFGVVQDFFEIAKWGGRCDNQSTLQICTAICGTRARNHRSKRQNSNVLAYTVFRGKSKAQII